MVFTRREVLKIIKTCIAFVAVLVVALVPVWTRADEGFGYKNVDVNAPLDTFRVQRDARVVLAPRSVVSFQHDTANSPHKAGIADFVGAFKAVNLSPFHVFNYTWKTLQQPPSSVGSDGLTPEQRGEREHVNPIETKIPIGHYCKAPDVRILPSETKAHHCDCEMVCGTDPDGHLVERTAPECKSYCEVGGRKCTCHTEQPCPGTMDAKHNALMDMHGAVSAMKVRR